MKKYLAMVCAAMMCVCCLALAACGGGAASSGSATAASASAAASSAAAADPAEELVGTWKFAALEAEGITMTGDLSMMLGDDVSADLVIEADGTGTMTFAGEASDITWTDEGDGAFKIGVADSDETIDATLEDDVLSFNMEDDEMSGVMLFTKSGEIDTLKTIDASAAEKITSDADLTGTYKLSGMNMMGVTMYGDPEDLIAAMGDATTDTTVVFDGNGTVTLMGEELTYSVDATDGAAIEEGDIAIPIMKLGDDIAIDMTSILGLNLVMVFSE